MSKQKLEMLNTEKMCISQVDSDHSRYNARKQSFIFPAQDLNRSSLMGNFSVTENKRLADSDHSRYEARERSSVFPARDLNRIVHSCLTFR